MALFPDDRPATGGGTNGTTSGYNVFAPQQKIAVNRVGKKVIVKGLDGTFQETDSVEANLLFEILQEMRKGKRL